MREYFDQPLFSSRKINAVLSWITVAYLLLNALNIFLDANFTWFLYALSVLFLVSLPVITTRDPESLVPFEVLMFLAVPFTLKGVEIGFIASRTINYLSASAVALLVVTELDTFTSFRTTPRFAVFIVALATVAISGIWAVARWISDIYLGTTYIVSEYMLMWEFAAATLAGLLAGKIFGIYFRRRDRRLEKG